MPNYVISPETREILRQAREALERREQAQAEQNRVPSRVAAFWFAEEAECPPWRMESSEERERREELESAGVRWL
jgi:hypothetical protein